MSSSILSVFNHTDSLKQLRAEGDKRRAAERDILPLLPKAIREHIHIAHICSESITLMADPRHSAVYWLRYQEEIILKNINKINTYRSITSLTIRFAPKSLPKAQSPNPQADRTKKIAPKGLKTMWQRLQQSVKDPTLKKTFERLSNDPIE
jgi:hypothetical protein